MRSAIGAILLPVSGSQSSLAQKNEKLSSFSAMFKKKAVAPNKQTSAMGIPHRAAAQNAKGCFPK